MRAGIALGSNIGDRLANLRAARSRVLALADSLAKCSRIFETEPVGCDPEAQPFLNAVVEIEWSSHASPESLLGELREIERAMGRPARYPKNAPRVIDLDVLYLDELVLKTDLLTLPHPRLRERRFVLAPLADIRPELILPGENATVAELLARLPDEPRAVAGDFTFKKHKMNAADFSAMKAQGEKISVLTAYDYPTARMLEESGVDMVLVGDSLGMVVLGFPDTTLVTMEHMLHHTAAVARGITQTFILADLPFGSYPTPGEAVENARRLMDAGAQAVKLEGALIPQIEAVVSAEIPVMAHLGMLPQSVRIEGGYKRKGVTEAEADALLAEARSVEKAGAFALLLELVRAETAERISTSISIPTIGIGSGPGCDGQVLVTHDLIGLFPWFKPKFVTRAADVAGDIREAVRGFIRQTKTPLP